MDSNPLKVSSQSFIEKLLLNFKIALLFLLN